MEQQLYKVITKLNTDPRFCITVQNLVTGAKICCNKNASQLKEIYGSVNEFFESLKKQGINKIGIRTRRPNGRSFVNDVEPFLEISFGEYNQQQTNAPTVEKPLPSVSPVVYPDYTQGLKGVLPMPVENFVNMSVASNDKVRLESENIYLKKRVEDLEAQNYQHRENEMQAKFSSDERKDKSASNKDLLESVTNSPVALMIIEKLAGAFIKAPIPEIASALGNPSNLSETKQILLESIQASDEPTANVLLQIFDRFNNPDFCNSITELITKTAA